VLPLDGKAFKIVLDTYRRLKTRPNFEAFAEKVATVRRSVAERRKREETKVDETREDDDMFGGFTFTKKPRLV
jgi:hypothetical protein